MSQRSGLNNARPQPRASNARPPAPTAKNPKQKIPPKPKQPKEPKLSKREIETLQNIQHKKQLREHRENILQRIDEKRKRNEGVEVTTTTIRNDLGQLVEIKDLSPYWVTRPSISFLSFLPIDLSLSINILHNSESQNARLNLSEVGYTQETILECLSFLIEDLSLLLRLRYNIFWSHVLYNKSLQKFLDSFLRFAHRTHDAIQEGGDKAFSLDWKNDSIYVPLLEKVFRVFVRMSAPSEGLYDHFEPSNYGELLYKHKLLDVPKLMDICLVFGKANHDIVQKMVSTAFAYQKGLTQDLSITAVLIYDQLQSLFQQTSKARITHQSWTETRGFVLDVNITLYSFFSLYPDATEHFFPNIANRVFQTRVNPSLRNSTFYTDTKLAYLVLLQKWFHEVELPVAPAASTKGNKSNTQKEKLVVEKIQAALVQVGQMLIKSRVLPVLRTAPNSQDYRPLAEELLQIVIESGESPVYHRNYVQELLLSLPQIFEELLSLKRLPKDSIYVPKLIQAIAKAEKLLKGKRKTPADVAELQPTQTELASIQQLKELFPDHSTQYLLRCLRFYNKEELSDLTSRLLDNKIDPSISQAASSPSSAPPLPLTGQILLPTSMRMKQAPKLEGQSKQEKAELKSKILQKYLFQNEYEYEDEYDDTYDEFQSFQAEPENLEEDSSYTPSYNNLSRQPFSSEELEDLDPPSNRNQQTSPADAPFQPNNPFPASGRGRGRGLNHNRKSRAAKKRGFS